MQGIGIAGDFCAGKTTAAEFLVKEHGFSILGFGTPLYELGEIHLRDDYDWNASLKCWITKNLVPLGYNFQQRASFRTGVLEAFATHRRTGGKNRSLLQTVGTEIGRSIDEEMWIKVFTLRAESLGPGAKVVNDNVRYPNEMDAIEHLGFTTVYLDVIPEAAAERYEKEYGELPTQEQLAHSSEAYKREIRLRSEYVFDNSGDPEKLRRFLNGVVSRG